MANDPAASAALEYRKRKAESIKGSIEHREFGVAGLEVRALDDGTLRMSGYGSVTEVEYPIGRSFTEVIKRGAFKRTLSESPDTVLLYGHEGMPLARTKTGTLVMEEDAKGLKWTADLDAEDPESRVLARKVEKGLIDQCSFAFLVTGETWSDDWDHRSITSVSIHRGDISLVAMGANEATSVQNVRALNGVIGVLEQRAGKTLSASTMDVLTRVLKLVADADEAVDEAQPLLADLMGVDNPDADDGIDNEAGDDVERDHTDDAETRVTEDQEEREKPTADELKAQAEALLAQAAELEGEAVEETERAAEKPETREIPLPDFTTRAAQEYELMMLRERGRR